MKSSEWDNRLWQIKMQELPLEGDANAAWDKMQGLLDETMPVAQGSGVVRKLWGLPRSLVLTVICTVAAAAILFFTAHYLLKNHPHKPVKPNRENVKPGKIQVDSSKSTGNKFDSAENNPATALQNKGDSLSDDAASTKTNSNNRAADNNSNDRKKAGGTIVNGPSKHQNTLVQAQSLAAGNVLAANSKINHPHNKPSATGHYLAGRRNMGLYSAGQHSPVPGLPVNSGNNKPASPTALMLADKNSPKTNTLSLINKGNPAASQNPNKPVSNASAVQQKNTDSAKMASNKLNPPSKPGVNNISTNKSGKPGGKSNVKSSKKESYSKFELDIQAGINSNKNSTAAFAGLLGSYAINPQLSVGTGINLFSSRIIEGGYSNSKYHYTTIGDSGKIIKHTADKLVVTSSQKIYTVEIPITATYKITNWLSVKGGPMISIPVKTGGIKNTLGAISTPSDTTSAFRTISAAANSTTINSRVNLNISGGINININRVYINAGYVQGLSPYTISSSLGKGSVYYHSLQFGIGYKLFKSTPKK